MKGSDCLWRSRGSAGCSEPRLPEPSRSSGGLPHTDVDALVSDGPRMRTSSSVRLSHRCSAPDGRGRPAALTKVITHSYAR